MGPMNWLPWGMEPWEYLAFALFSAAVWRMVGYRWWLVPLLLSGLFLWPWVFRFFRWAHRFVLIRLRATGINRRPGALYCAECGAVLSPEGEGGASFESCPACSGKWFSGSVLGPWLSKNKPGLGEWLAFAGKVENTEFLCPKCFERMACGSFRGAAFTTFRCGPCDGYWLSRVNWVSLKLA